MIFAKFFIYEVGKDPRSMDFYESDGGNGKEGDRNRDEGGPKKCTELEIGTQINVNIVA